MGSGDSGLRFRAQVFDSGEALVRTFSRRKGSISERERERERSVRVSEGGFRISVLQLSVSGFRVSDFRFRVLSFPPPPPIASARIVIPGIFAVVS